MITKKPITQFIVGLITNINTYTLIHIMLLWQFENMKHYIV